MEFIGISVWTFVQAMIGGLLVSLGVMATGWAITWALRWYASLQCQLDEWRDR